MQILEAGISIPRANGRIRRLGNRGFTILEILVVVAVLAISATTILLNTTFSKPERALGKHAHQLSRTIRLLYQEAILNDRNFAISVQPGKYLVLDFDGQGWVPSQEKFFSDFLKSHQFEDEITIDREILVIEKQSEPQPHLLILSNGEMTPFNWKISEPDSELQVTLQGGFLGNIIIEGPTREDSAS